MKTKSFLSGTAALALSALLFTSCNNDDTPEPAISSEYVTIAPSVTGEVITKADDVAYGEQNDKLYLYYNTAGNSTDNQSADFRFDGSIWDLGTKKMKWSTLHNAEVGTTLSFYATAPIPAPTAATSVEANQSTAANYIKSDLLVAYQPVTKAATPKYDALPITLKHVLAKLTIEINAKALGDNATISKVTIQNAITAYTTDYSPASGIPATTTVEGSDKIDVTPLPANNSVYTAILPAQAIQETKGITINIATGDGKSFTYQPANAINLLQGKNTTLKLRLAGEGVILGTVELTEWEDGTTTEGNIDADTAP